MVSLVLINTQIHFAIIKNEDAFEFYTVPDIMEPYMPAQRDIVVLLQTRG